MVSDLTHRLLDLAWEDYRSTVLAEEPRGSTGRGITPAYLDEVGQAQISYSDFLAGPNFFARKLAQRADRACRVIQHVCRVTESTWDSLFAKLTAAEQRANAEAIGLGIFSAEEFDFARFKGGAPYSLNLEALTETYWRAGTALARNIGEVRELIRRELRAGRTIIGEFGQAYWLDEAPRLLAERHRVAHLHARVFRERRHPGAAHPHLRRGQGLRHQGGHPYLYYADGRCPSPGPQA
jgi:adenylosuccinate synthase